MISENIVWGTLKDIDEIDPIVPETETEVIVRYNDYFFKTHEWHLFGLSSNWKLFWDKFYKHFQNYAKMNEFINQKYNFPSIMP